MTGPTMDVTYGELVDAARLAAHRAMTTLCREPFPDADAARWALASRARLLQCLGRHAEILIGPARVQGWRDGAPPPRRGIESRNAVVTATLEWIDTLTTTPPVRGMQAVGGRPAAAVHWDHCRALVAAASDTVATHRDPATSQFRGPAGSLASADIGGLLVSTAQLVAIIAPTEPLAARCRQAGLTRTEVDRTLPVGDPLVEDTWQLATTWGFPAPAIANLTVARPRIDTSTPAAEWRTRLDAVHARLARHEQRGRISVRTLHDVAILGAVTARVLATASTPDPTGPGSGSGDWVRMLTHLAPLRSSEPRDRVIHRHVERMLHVAHPTHTADDPAARSQLLAAITATAPAVEACGQIADRMLTAHTDAWIPAPNRAPYLRSPSPPGRAVTRPGPAPTPWPSVVNGNAASSGLSLT